MKLRPLPPTVRSNQTNRTQILRQGRWAIYRCIPDSTPNIPHFEVIRIHTQKPHHLDANPEGFNLVEVYPSAEQWGSNGWTCQTLQQAQTRLEKESLKKTQTAPI